MKKNKMQRIVGLLYLFVIATFVILEPWGKVDTRNFAYMGPLKFWEYNVYIVFVLFSMLVLSWRLFKNRIGVKTLIWIVSTNIMFIVMCVFDILHFFPDPIQSMPFWVLIIEVVDSVAAFLIILISPKILPR